MKACSLKTICLACKYIFFIALNLVLFSVGLTGRKGILCAAVEVLLIFTLTNLLCKRFPRIAWCLNSVSLLIGNMQNVVRLYGSSFVTLQMLTNLGSISDISGHAAPYVVSVLLVAVFSFLPVARITLSKSHYAVLSMLAVALFGAGCFLNAFMYSPFYHTGLLVSDAFRYERLGRMAKDGEINAVSFFRGGGGVQDSVGFGFDERPNVILIFTEGLSENIIHDERSIMPNAAALESKSLHFRNYYNHTFATYMGLSGQLYSGYQEQNLDVNFLPSLQSILSKNGYRTCFINTEPMNSDFSGYLLRFGFDEVISDTARLNGMVDSMSDGDAYDFLYTTALELDDRDEPFFLVIYTFGTHASFDSSDRTFADGSDPLLNKFYNADSYLGEFLERFENSRLYDSTILCFTADHCTYQDADFRRSFPSYGRYSTVCDTVPLMLYWKDVDAGEVDAHGRNSLSLAPTLLDVLDVSEENFFLGNSLFGDPSKYEHIFQSLLTILTTQNGSVSEMKKSLRREFERQLSEYFVLKQLENFSGEDL